jgi:hypothetical protein
MGLKIDSTLVTSAFGIVMMGARRSSAKSRRPCLRSWDLPRRGALPKRLADPRRAVPGIPHEEEPMLSASEAAIEAELKTKGLNAPRLTPADIDATIVGEDYHVFAGTTVTVCALKLRNGYVVIGESTAASLESFDAAIGRRVARDAARNKIWALEGYLLRSRLAAA